MATTKKRFVFHADPALAAWLEEKSRETGAPVAEVCRRAIVLAAFADAHSGNDTTLLKIQRPSPVLFTKKASV